MMALYRSRIALKLPRERFTSAEKAYYQWMHTDVGRCCLSARPDGLEIAHTGRLAQGKGMGRKPRLDTCLPLHSALHAAEERNREEFWHQAGFPGDERFAWSERLYDIFETSPDDYLAITHWMSDMWGKANRGNLIQWMK